jgi:hypothetical protein
VGETAPVRAAPGTTEDPLRGRDAWNAVPARFVETSERGPLPYAAAARLHTKDTFGRDRDIDFVIERVELAVE